MEINEVDIICNRIELGIDTSIDRLKLINLIKVLEIKPFMYNVDNDFNIKRKLIEYKEENKN
ncbi:hypothetical protein [Lutibacter sp.]|uniref:hypothetical protein n=1 Tax=Lutibacter sp. TaxID=1925666 RepID=UPI0025C3B9C3|nr:hypothetical protein [Lutibacter sp.]